MPKTPATPTRQIDLIAIDWDGTLFDSTAIITYLDGLKPDPELIPRDLKARAKTIWFEEFSDTILAATSGKMFGNRVLKPMFRKIPGDPALIAEAEAELPAILDYLEATIPASGFLVEDRLTLADLAVASPFVNLDHCQFTVNGVAHPKTAAYVAAILARPSFAAWVSQEKAFMAKLAG